MTAKLGTDGVRRTLRVDRVGDPVVDLQTIEVVPAAVTAGVAHILNKLIEKSMPSMLAETLMAFPLTKLQIGRLPGIPKDAVWTLEESDIVRPAGAQEFIMRGRLSTLPAVLADTAP